jgi:hypothetical protein
MSKKYTYGGMTIERKTDTGPWTITTRAGAEFGTAPSVSKAQKLINKHILDRERAAREATK